MHKQSGHFFLSPSDVGIEKYRLDDIIERMKPVEPQPNDELLSFAHIVSALLEDTSDEFPTMKSAASK